MPHCFINPPCPFLPHVDRVYGSADAQALGSTRGSAFYTMSLSYAQSQWQVGLPAQALLQVNRALACCLGAEEEVLAQWPLPYKTMAWLMVQRTEGQFLGNPRRHFQHLATRMVEPNKALRVWRAWACWYLATMVLPEAEYPGDAAQIYKEGVVEPTRAMIAARLRELSPADDEERWREAIEWAEDFRGKPAARPSAGVEIAVIGTEELAVVQQLAQRIWPVVYPRIISLAQIDYMLERMYALPVLRADAERGVCYAVLRSEGEAIGYLGCEAVPGAGEMLLHKLYILPEYAGAGLGALGLQWVCERARALGLARVVLRVNKANAGAIRAYRRAGFVFRAAVVADIGAGFVMDDYEMECGAAITSANAAATP